MIYVWVYKKVIQEEDIAPLFEEVSLWPSSHLSRYQKTTIKSHEPSLLCDNARQKFSGIFFLVRISTLLTAMNFYDLTPAIRSRWQQHTASSPVLDYDRSQKLFSWTSFDSILLSCR